MPLLLLVKRVSKPKKTSNAENRTRPDTTAGVGDFTFHIITNYWVSVFSQATGNDRYLNGIDKLW